MSPRLDAKTSANRSGMDDLAERILDVCLRTEEAH
jgi:hypothetical protein